jgi:hypothetical protein
VPAKFSLKTRKHENSVISLKRRKKTQKMTNILEVIDIWHYNPLPKSTDRKENRLSLK